MLRWSVSNITMTSGRAAASSSFCAPNSLAISQSGPSRLTKNGKIGVCGTPKPPTICAMSTHSCHSRASRPSVPILDRGIGRRQPQHASIIGRITWRASRKQTAGQAPRQRRRGATAPAVDRAAPGAARAWPLRLFADRRPAAAALAERRPRRGLGHPQYRAFPVRPAGDTHLRRPGRAHPGRAELLLARLRRARRHLADDGGDGAARRATARSRSTPTCAREYPRIIEEGKKLGWEWMGHGITNSILIGDQTRGRGARADQGQS